MLRTPLCDVLGIEAPVILGSLGPLSSAGLTAAVSAAGGLGSQGVTMLTAERLALECARIRELTDRPFAVNHTMRPFNEDLFALTLELAPAVVSLALGDPGGLVERAHAAGSLFMQQVHTVDQAKRAADAGVDVVIAQGSEAGGFTGTVALMPLLPQVVDAVAPLPVVAAGGIADGRGLAAALALGAQGVNVGTRFLASTEAAVDAAWKAAIVAARSEHTTTMDFVDAVLPPSDGGYAVRPRSLVTPFLEEWNRRLDEVPAHAPRLRQEIVGALAAGRLHEVMPMTGQSAGLVTEVLPAAEIVRRFVAEAEAALAAVTS